MMEPLIVFESILRKDPAGAYPKMDFESREDYRERIAEIARHSECSRNRGRRSRARTRPRSPEPRLHRPAHRPALSHIGYYLLDKGFHALAAAHRIPSSVSSTACAISFAAMRMTSTSAASRFLPFMLIAAIILPLVPNYSILGGLTLRFSCYSPAAQGAVDLVNNAVTSLFKATALPKLDFSEGIPARIHHAGRRPDPAAEREAGP